MALKKPIASYDGDFSIIQSGDVLDPTIGGTGLSSFTTGNFLRAESSTSLGQRTPAQVRSDIGAPSTSGAGATGTWSISVSGGSSQVNAVDDRDVKPNETGTSALKAIKPFFVIKEQIDGGSGGTTYGDFLVLDTYSDASGGKVNALFFAKGSQSIYHYQGVWNGVSWDAPKQLAYTDAVTPISHVGTGGSAHANATTSSAGFMSAADKVKLDALSQNNIATLTSSSISPVALYSFPIATNDMAEITIVAKVGVNRHTTKMLITHDGTNAVATEYGTLTTSSELFNVYVDVNSGNIRVLVACKTAVSTAFKCKADLIAA